MGGRLGGLIDAHNNVMASQVARLDEIAFSFVQAFNTQHQSGTTPGGQPGGPFFEPLTTSVGAARNIQVSPPSWPIPPHRRRGRHAERPLGQRELPGAPRPDLAARRDA
jgi:hypothetical protein